MHRRNIVKSLQVDTLSIEVYETVLSVGEAAATYVATKINQFLEEKERVNILFATGVSQFTFFDALKRKGFIDWSKIAVFHLDEYLDLSENHPASVRKYMRDRILDEVTPGEILFLNGDVDDIEAEIKRYENLLQTHPVDIACIGIGENGHIAFNDPAIANFNDPQMVKKVQLDEISRMQQVGEGWFHSLEEVPLEALSLTIPALMSAKIISCVVPEERKAIPVYNTIYEPITTDCPASILRTHPNVKLFLDRFSASNLK
jgi:glucosamine-6-phosphate deaminase